MIRLARPLKKKVGSKLLRICFVTIFLTCVCFVRLSLKPLDYHDEKLNEISSNDFGGFKTFLDGSTETARRNLIIVSHGRSGSTLTGDIFNHHPSVFYMYEPLQTAQRVHKKNTNQTSYNRLAGELLASLVRCRFDQPQMLADIESYYRKPAHPRVSHAMGSPPLCPYEMKDPRWSPERCPPMSNQFLGGVCKDKYDITVLKILLSRIPENNMKTVLTACNSQDVDCKIIFLVRDPRAVIPSSLQIGFFKEQGGSDSKLGTRVYSYALCQQTEKNLELVRKLPDSLRTRIKLLRYEDLAMEPLKALDRLYNFAGLPVLDSIRAWLNETTQQSRKACNRELDGPLVTCTKDDAWAAANRWRWKVHPHEINMIEHYCRGTMRLMGYRPVDMSHDLLANDKIPLFSDDYEAKHWFLNFSTREGDSLP